MFSGNHLVVSSSLFYSTRKCFHLARTQKISSLVHYYVYYLHEIVETCLTFETYRYTTSSNDHKFYVCRNTVGLPVH